MVDVFMACSVKDIVVNHVPDLGGKAYEGKDTGTLKDGRLEAGRSCQ
jgi:hypothetical protein